VVLLGEIMERPTPASERLVTARRRATRWQPALFAHDDMRLVHGQQMRGVDWAELKSRENFSRVTRGVIRRSTRKQGCVIRP
jgi:hypothetical protein